MTLFLSLLVGGCEKTSHENIDKWMGTPKGPSKLMAAASNTTLDADLSAHAAANLIFIGQDTDVRKLFENSLPAERRTAVMAKLAPRLWERARIEGEMTIPDGGKISAKDAMFDMRKFADADGKKVIDGYLTDWYTSGYYEGRAKLGRFIGAQVLRTIGPSAGPGMIRAANSILAKPSNGKTRTKIGDELLLGLAATGNPDDVKYVLDVLAMDRGDETLAPRAMNALYKSFVNSDGLFDVNDPKALVPYLDTLIAVAKSEKYPHQMANDAVELIRVAGMPGCLAPLVSMVSSDSHDIAYRYVGANNAIQCGGAKAIADVANALPTNIKYDHAEIGGAIWTVIAKLSPREPVIAALRPLLTSKSWVARWIAIESLAAMKSTEDGPKLRAMANDRAPLQGYWGDQSGAKPKKPDPTLGQRAAELAKSLGA